MAAMALAAAYLVQTKALPSLNRETSDLFNRLPLGTRWIVGLRDHLMLLPIPALALGITAIALRPLRPVLAPLASIAAILAVVAIVGALVVGLIPLYQVPADLGAG
jgi:hypothetical protein